MGPVDVCHEKVASACGENRPWHGGHSLREQEQAFLRGLIRGMRCGVLAVDRHERLTMINDLGREILGLSPSVCEGAPIREALSDHPRLIQVLRDSFTMSSLPNRAELDLDPGAAGSKTIGFTLSMVCNEAGRRLGAAVFFKDLTPIEQKEEQERLKGRLSELGQMAASLAHEIRNPLASITVTCSLLRRRLGTDDLSRELLDKVDTEVQRLNQTITSSLDFVRPVSLDLAHAQLVPVLEEAIQVARGRRARPGVDVVRRFESIPPFLMDRERIRQIFENLILNAIEAIPDRGRVTIETGMVPAPRTTSVPYRPGDRPPGDPLEARENFDRFAVVRVSDSGRGIPAEERDKIFYPFFTTKEEGSGVGLSVVKKIVSSHHGLIDVDTSTSGGALFTVRLPMIDEKREVR